MITAAVCIVSTASQLPGALPAGAAFEQNLSAKTASHTAVVVRPAKAVVREASAERQTDAALVLPARAVVKEEPVESQGTAVVPSHEQSAALPNGVHSTI